MIKENEEATCCCGSEASQSRKPKFEFPELPSYKNPAGDEYPVIAYNNVPLESKVLVQGEEKRSPASPKDIRTLMDSVKECGFNVNLWRSGRCDEESLLNNYFDITEELGLSTVLSIMEKAPVVRHISPYYFTTEYEYRPSPADMSTALGLYKDRKSLWGYLLMDEPKFVYWAVPLCKIPKNSPSLAMEYLTYSRNTNGLPAYFNLAVSTDKDTIGSVLYEKMIKHEITAREAYEIYLYAIVNQFHPLMLTVDVYPVRKKESKPNFEIKSDYYYSLEVIGEVSSNSSIPFWLYLLCNQHTINKEDGTPKTTYPKPSVGLLRFQAMTAIAFGIQGLVFWSYGMPEDKKFSNGNTKEKYICAPYMNDQKTELWSYCQEVIPEIKKYGGALLGATYLDARHVYGPDSDQRFPGTIAFDGQFGCISSASALGKGFVITYLKKGSTKYMAIVSHDYKNSQDITFSIPSRYNWSYVVSEESDAFTKTVHKTLEAGEETIRRRLDAGGIILISY